MHGGTNIFTICLRALKTRFLIGDVMNTLIAITIWLAVGFVCALRFTYVMRVKPYAYSDIFASIFLSVLGPLLAVMGTLIAVAKKLDRPVFKNEGPRDWYEQSKKRDAK
jgi:hypothetical protein